MESISRRRRRVPGWCVTVVALVMGVLASVGGEVVAARSTALPAALAVGSGPPPSPRQPWTGGLAAPAEGFRPAGPGAAGIASSTSAGFPLPEPTAAEPWAAGSGGFPPPEPASAALIATPGPLSPITAEPWTSDPALALGLSPTGPAAFPSPEPAVQWATALMAAADRPSSVAAAPWAGSARATPQPRLSWPLSPVPVIMKYFDAPETPYGAGHRGVDLAAVPGQEVLAADAGVVVFAGLVAGRPVISVDHDGGLRTTYEPVAPQVAVGEQVYRGQVLGTVLAGHPGCPVAACLHWGVRRGEEYVDPLALTGEVGEYRLKPWGGGP